METDTEESYYKVLRIKENTTVSDELEVLIKKLPKKVISSAIFITQCRDKQPLLNSVYTVYEHDNRKVIRDRREFARERFGDSLVLRVSSNISDGEYYYNIFIPELPPSQEAAPKQTTPPSTQEKPLSKAELKKILEEHGVRVYYHDTLATLNQKLKDIEAAGPKSKKKRKQ